LIRRGTMAGTEEAKVTPVGKVSTTEMPVAAEGRRS
jgi:hypothetical protein